jgi:transposase-like protein
MAAKTKKRRVSSSKPEKKERADEETKLEAVRRHVIDGDPAAALADEFDVSVPTIYAWKAKYGDMVQQRAAPTPSDTIKLTPEDIDTLTEAKELFGTMGFTTDFQHLVSMAIQNVDYNVVLENQVESIRQRLKAR